jgi:hypothetical protein
MWVRRVRTTKNRRTYLVEKGNPLATPVTPAT